jgi:hypothetical protein
MLPSPAPPAGLRLTKGPPRSTIEPGEGGYPGSLGFYSLAEAKVVIESWRWHYNAGGLQSASGYRPPAPEVILHPAPPAARALVPKTVVH